MKWSWNAACWSPRFVYPIRTIQGGPRRNVRPRLEPLEDRWLPSTFTVLDNSDNAADANSFRYALNHLSAGSNAINFDITGSTTIKVLSPLPAITRQVSILGFTQGGAGYNGPPLVVLNGASAGNGADGLNFASGSNGSEVQGLVIQQFKGDGILINGTSGNLIVGNYIGTDLTGTAKLGNNDDGVAILGGASGNTVGGTSSGSANVISGSNNSGVYLYGGGTSGNVVLGNLIGTDKTGTAEIGNVFGVYIGFGASENTVGGTTSGAANVISANFEGVYLGYSGTSGNVVLGNLIGTDINGTANLGNTNDGVLILNNATANTVGGSSSGAANVISGNVDGVYLNGTSGNVVLGNLIGTDITGSANLGNTNGVAILGAHRRTRWVAPAAALPMSSPATPTAAFICMATGRVATWCWATASAPTSPATPISATAKTA